MREIIDRLIEDFQKGWARDVSELLNLRLSFFLFMSIGILFIHIHVSRQSHVVKLLGRFSSIIEEFRVNLIVLYGLLVLMFFQVLYSPKVSIDLFVGLTLLFGTTTYVLMVDFFLSRGAKYFNKWRKGKWIKELEYPYLFLGAVGLYISINRLEFLEGATRKFDLVGPILIAAAVAIKFMKVRAETNDWDKIT